MTNRIEKALLAAMIAGSVAVTLEGAGAQDVDCQGDEPCWDCETMGNLLCGPVVYDATLEDGVTLSEFTAEVEAQYGEGVAIVAISAAVVEAEPAIAITTAPAFTG